MIYSREGRRSASTRRRRDRRERRGRRSSASRRTTRRRTPWRRASSSSWCAPPITSALRRCSSSRPSARGRAATGPARPSISSSRAWPRAPWRRTSAASPRAGVGIYTNPRTQFVHLDVRDQSYHWVDASPPGVKWHEAQLRDPRRRKARRHLDAPDPTCPSSPTVRDHARRDRDRRAAIADRDHRVVRHADDRGSPRTVSAACSRTAGDRRRDRAMPRRGEEPYSRTATTPGDGSAKVSRDYAPRSQWTPVACPPAGVGSA